MFCSFCCCRCWFLWLCIGGRLLSAQASGIVLFPNCPDRPCPGQALGICVPLKRRGGGEALEPQQPRQWHCLSSSTGGSAKAAISGHLPGFSPCPCTFLCAHPWLLQLLGSCCASRAGGHRHGQGAEGPCRFLELSACPQPHCSVGCSRHWHPLLLGCLQGGSSSSCPGQF